MSHFNYNRLYVQGATMYPIQRFTDEYAESLLSFLQCCLPESGRQLDLKGWMRDAAN